MVRSTIRKQRAAFALMLSIAAVSCGPPLQPMAGAPVPAPRRDSVVTGNVDISPRTPAPVRTEEPVRRDSSPPALSAADLIPPPLSREFRGVWVASVANIDWPSRRGLSTEESRAELIALLDRAVQLKLNAVILQVRPAADALYASTIEPWSEYLTGEQGKAPSPFWDPLEVAVREAHARGLELHAWFNPYRARHIGAKSPLASTHISRTSPALVKTYGPYLWMDPGEAAVRQRTLRVVLDVVKRYDIDGVHIDDYFYPYQERNKAGRIIDFPDLTSYRRYTRAGGKLSRDDWRRRNVDMLVQELYEGIHRTKPWVKFGISPFGIWRPGYPAQVRGLDAYTTLYADARKWLREGWLDYFTPQLYWPTTRVEQSYPALLEWWASENAHQRHLWPGNFTSRSGGRGASSWPVSELVEQIRVTRLQAGATGNVHFSMKPFLDNQAGLNDALLAGPYATPAIVPATPWLRMSPPPAPVVHVVDTVGRKEVRFTTRGTAQPWQYVVRARVDTGWVVQVLPGTVTRWTIPRGASAAFIGVTTLNRVGVASEMVSVAHGATTDARSTAGEHR